MIRILTILAVVCLGSAGLRSAEAAAPASGILARMQRGQAVTIVAFGDSLTENSTWPKLLEAWLNRLGLPGKATVINAGKAGSTTKSHGVKDCATDVVQRRPDAVFIGFGMNDCIKRPGQEVSVPLAAFTANLGQIVDAIRAGRADTEILMLTLNVPHDVPGRSPNSGSYRSALPDYYQAIRDLAAKRGLLLVDVHKRWLVAIARDPQAADALVPDGTHPNSKADETITLPAIQAVLDPQHRDR